MKTLCLIIIYFLIFYSNLNSQSENRIKIGLIEPFFLTFNAAYEKFIPNSPFSVQLSGSLTQRNVTIWENIKPSLSGFSFDLQGRYYAFHEKKKGIYGALFTEYSQYKLKLRIPDGDVNFLDGNSKLIGLAAGWQIGFASKLYVDFTLGGGYHIADYSGRFSDKGRLLPSIVSNGILPKVDVKFGIGF